MPATRRKSKALPAPQSLPEAIELIERYVALEVGCIQLEEEAEKAIAAIRGECDRTTKPLKAEANDIFRQLSRWWAVAGPEITEGKSKSTKLAGCEIGTRLSTPKLTLGNHKAEEIVKALLEGGWDEFVRTKRELDRQGLIKAMKGDHRERLTAIGVSVTQTDEFYIDRPKPRPEPVEIVEEEAA